MDEKAEQIEVEVVEIYESSKKSKYFLMGTADFNISLSGHKVEVRNAFWAIEKNSIKPKVRMPFTYTKKRVGDEKVNERINIIKFVSEENLNILKIIVEAIRKDINELYKDEIEQHRQLLEKQKEETEKDLPEEKSDTDA